MSIEELTAALSDRYTIERELSGGAMSRVFLARETALGRSVVVKMLTPDLAAGLSAERFTREIATAARLQQANIVPLLTTGKAQGVPWYSMPYVSGESLRAKLGHGQPIPLADAVHILRDVARALAFAHAAGVVHRDIKPENILLSGGAAVVTDFGIAKAVTVSRTEDGSTSALTQTGVAIGTPAYMAPEQVAGDPTIDHRADIYALGVVAWELIAGKHPFARRTSSTAMLGAHMSEKPVSLTASRADLVPRVAADNETFQAQLEALASRLADAGLGTYEGQRQALARMYGEAICVYTVWTLAPRRSRWCIVTAGPYACETPSSRLESALRSGHVRRDTRQSARSRVIRSSK